MSTSTTYISNDELRTKQGQEDQVRSIIMAAKGIDRGEARDRFCYQIYSGDINDDRFSYLTNVGENRMPAKVRWFPVITARCNKLISQEARRKIKSRIFLSDQRSVKEKMERSTQRLFTLLTKRISAFNERLIFEQNRINQAKQRLTQLSQQSERKPEENSELARLGEMIPFIELRLNQLLSNLKYDQFLGQKDLEENERYMLYKDKDIIEEAFEGALNEAIRKQHIAYQKVNAFRDKIITGKELYLVDWEPGMPNPTFEHIPVMGVNWSNEQNKTFIQHCRWAIIERDVTMNDILIKFGNELAAPDIQDMLDFSGATMERNGYVVPTPRNGAVFPYEAGSFKAIGGKNLSLQTVYWKQSRNAVWKEVKNTKGLKFYHVVEEDYTPKKNETVQKRYVDDLWVGHSINGKYFPGIKKHPVQLRDYENPSEVELPVVGYAHNNPYLKPYSIIWETRDVQESISVMAYHRELLFAISGVKGLVMDMSQKPDMSDEEWFYDFKRGIAWIQTNKGGRQQTYNQFQTYDNTVSPAVGMISEIIVHLEDMIGMVTGVSRESMGNTKSSDQVGTYQMATEASNIITYILFYEHDVLLSHALTRFINLGRYAWREGKEGTYMSNDQAQRVFKIYPDMAIDRRLDMYVSDDAQENDKMNHIIQAAIQARNNREITLTQLISILDSDSLKEVEKKVEYYTKKMAELAQDNAMALEQKRAEVEQMNIKLEKEYDAMIENAKLELEKINLMLQKANTEIKRTEMFLKAQLEREKIASAERIANQNANKEAAVELAYLDEEKTMHRTDEAIRQAELGIDSLVAVGNLMVANKQANIKKSEARSKTMAKEKIKDN